MLDSGTLAGGVGCRPTPGSRKPPTGFAKESKVKRSDVTEDIEFNRVKVHQIRGVV